MRFGLVLLVVCGCDLVIPLTKPEPAACGPYTTVTPVVFDPALLEPSDFSVHYNGTQGMVRARVATGPSTTYTGPVPLVLDEATGTWMLDTARFPRGLPALALDGGHLLGDGSFFGWIDAAGAEVPKLGRYRFQGTTNAMWSVDGMELALESDFSRNLRPGNEIVLMAEGDPLRFFPQIRIDFTGAMQRNQLVIRQRFAPQPWLPTDQAQKIARETYINPTSAVMTADHAILVYAASEHGGKQQIFASVRDTDDQFDLGRPVTIDLPGEVDDTEPWIGETCATLYFRRGGITYRAQ